jgi:hypothetical protein
MPFRSCASQMSPDGLLAEPELPSKLSHCDAVLIGQEKRSREQALK